MIGHLEPGLLYEGFINYEFHVYLLVAVIRDFLCELIHSHNAFHISDVHSSELTLH